MKVCKHKRKRELKMSGGDCVCMSTGVCICIGGSWLKRERESNVCVSECMCACRWVNERGERK